MFMKEKSKLFFFTPNSISFDHFFTLFAVFRYNPDGLQNLVRIDFLSESSNEKDRYSLSISHNDYIVEKIDIQSGSRCLSNILKILTTCSRLIRQNSDRFAAIRQFWECFNKRLLQHFTPSQYLCIDEQLITFRGRCPFRIYMKSKPGRYGLLIRWLSDAGNRYFLCGYPYAGVPKDPEAAELVKEKNRASNVVLNFAGLAGIKGSGRNITTDR